MKNLRVSYQSYVDLESLGDSPDSALLRLTDSENLCCLDNDGGDFYLYKENTVFSISVDKFEKFNLNNETLVDTKLVGFAFCDSTRQIYLAYESGQLFTLEIDTPDSTAEFAAQVNEGLRAIQLSPDHEIVTLITANDTLIVMTSGFHVITEVRFHQRHTPLIFSNANFVLGRSEFFELWRETVRHRWLGQERDSVPRFRG